MLFGKKEKGTKSLKDLIKEGSDALKNTIQKGTEGIKNTIEKGTHDIKDTTDKITEGQKKDPADKPSGSGIIGGIKDMKDKIEKDASMIKKILGIIKKIKTIASTLGKVITLFKSLASKIISFIPFTKKGKKQQQ